MRCHTLAIQPSQQHWLLQPRLSRSVVWTSTKTTPATAACFETKRHPYCRRWTTLDCATRSYRITTQKSWSTRPPTAFHCWVRIRRPNSLPRCSGTGSQTAVFLESRLRGGGLENRLVKDEPLAAP